jgi:hypothetical protein
LEFEISKNVEYGGSVPGFASVDVSGGGKAAILAPRVAEATWG